MYNGFLEYLKKNNPEDVLSKNGVMIRKAISPVIRGLASATAKYNFFIDGKAEIPKGRPIIYAPTHGFKDDLLFSIILIGRPAYILFGSLPQFYNTPDGISAWLNGSMIVDRTNPESRHAAIPKMEYAIDLGSDIIIFPEGVWNKRINLLVLDLFPGIYKVAKSKGALVAPLATHLEGDTVYGKLGEAFDIAQYDQKEGLQILRDKQATLKWDLMDKHSHASRDEFIGDYLFEKQWHKYSIDDEWNDYIESLIAQVEFYDREVEDNAEYKKPGKISEEEVYKDILSINPNSIEGMVTLARVRKSYNQSRII